MSQPKAQCIMEPGKWIYLIPIDYTHILQDTIALGHFIPFKAGTKIEVQLKFILVDKHFPR